MKKSEQKKIKDEVLKVWPDCPKEYLEEAFYFKNEPTPEHIVMVGHFADDVGTCFGTAEAFLGMLDRVRRIERLMIEKYGPGEMEDLLLEIRENHMRMIQWATTWDETLHPLHTHWNWRKHDEHLKGAIGRAEKDLEEMYPGKDGYYVDDPKRSRAEHRMGKADGR